MNTPDNRAGELMDHGYGCAEAVLLAIAEHRGIDSPLLPGIATGFCGGIGGTRKICGAVTGAVMALNLIYGRADATDQESKEANYAAVKKLMERFKQQFGTTSCDQLLEQGAFCRRYTVEAARAVLEIADDAG